MKPGPGVASNKEVPPCTREVYRRARNIRELTPNGKDQRTHRIGEQKRLIAEGPEFDRAICRVSELRRIAPTAVGNCREQVLKQAQGMTTGLSFGRPSGLGASNYAKLQLIGLREIIFRCGQ